MDKLPASINADTLTNALRRSGGLDGCRVIDVAVERSWTTVLSVISRLRLTYGSHTPDAPHSVIVKTGRPDRLDVSWGGARTELAFYTHVAPLTQGRLVPCCFETHSDEATKTWHLVLEDLTDSHVIGGEWPLPLSLSSCERIVAGHARRQASCWDHPRLETFMGEWVWRDEAATGRYLERLAAQVARFAEQVGDILPSQRRDLYTRLIDAAPRLGVRFRSRRNLTIVQGDAHVWNCFLPKDGGDDVRFFDWDSWRVDVGASDLSYMMAVHWYPDRRRRMETTLLDGYHAQLVAAGIDGYDRRALADDYRLETLWQITLPVWQQAYGIPPVIWWNNLERVMLAVEDLGCMDLL